MFEFFEKREFLFHLIQKKDFNFKNTFYYLSHFELFDADKYYDQSFYENPYILSDDKKSIMKKYKTVLYIINFQNSESEKFVVFEEIIEQIELNYMKYFCQCLFHSTLIHLNSSDCNSQMQHYCLQKAFSCHDVNPKVLFDTRKFIEKNKPYSSNVVTENEFQVLKHYCQCPYHQSSWFSFFYLSFKDWMFCLQEKTTNINNVHPMILIETRKYFYKEQTS